MMALHNITRILDVNQTFIRKGLLINCNGTATKVPENKSSDYVPEKKSVIHLVSIWQGVKRHKT